MKSKQQIFKEHYERASGKPCDEMILHHMNYAMDAMEEYRLQHSEQLSTDIRNAVLRIEERLRNQIKPLTESQIEEIIIDHHKEYGIAMDNNTMTMYFEELIKKVQNKIFSTGKE